MMNGDGDDADDGDGDGPPTVAPKPSSLAHVTLTRQGRDFGYWRIQSANASSTKWCFSRLHCASVGVFVCVRDSYTYNDTGNIETNEKTNSLLSRTHHILP